MAGEGAQHGWSLRTAQGRSKLRAEGDVVLTLRTGELTDK